MWHARRCIVYDGAERDLCMGGNPAKGRTDLWAPQNGHGSSPSHKGGALCPLTAFQSLLSALGRTKPEVLQKA